MLFIPAPKMPSMKLACAPALKALILSWRVASRLLALFTLRKSSVVCAERFVVRERMKGNASVALPDEA